MRNRFLKTSYYTALAVVCMGTANLAYVVSQTEIGGSATAELWWNPAFSWTGLEGTPVSKREPIEQANFWLNEIDRVLTQHSDSAELSMGAAWMLDSSNPEFIFENHMLKSKSKPLVPLFTLEVNEESVTKAKAEFRKLCHARCLELAARATELEPSNKHFWRMRALLLFEGDSLWSGQEFTPRSKNLLEVLDDCIAHDEDNALYDYLAAYTIWEESADYDWFVEDDQNSRWVLTIKDKEHFAMGVERFHKAQQRMYLAIGEEGTSSITGFLKECPVSKNQQSSAALSRLVTYRQFILFHALCRWQSIRLDAASSDRNPVVKLELLKQIIRLNEQAIIPQETPALRVRTSYFRNRMRAYKQISKLIRENPELMSAADFQKLRSREEELRIETATLTAALQKLHDETYPKTNQISVPAIMASVSSTSTALLVMIGSIFVVIARLLSRESQQAAGLGVFQQSIVWLLGCGGTFVLLGMAPAQFISHEIQARVLVITVWLVALLIAAMIVWRVVLFLHRRRFRFHLQTLFGIMTAVAVAAALWPAIEIVLLNITTLPPELWVHAKGWNGIDPEPLRTAMNVDVGSWTWSIIQWFAYSGLYIGLLLSLAFGGCWSLWLTARREKTSLLTFWTQDIRTRWAQWFRFIGSSAVSAAIFWLLIYLCFAPQFIRESEALFQYKMRYCRDPLAHYSEIRATQSAIISSTTDMKAIRKQVQAKLIEEEASRQEPE